MAMILKRMSEGTVRCNIRANSLDLFAQGSFGVLPVPHGNCVSNDDGHVHHGILDTDALVGPAPEDEVVSGVSLSGAVWV